MKRYDPLPFEWVRLIWTTQMAKDRWEPVLHAIAQAHGQIEKISVFEVLRRSYLGYTSESELAGLEAEAKYHGKVIVPLAKYEMDPDQSYYSSGASNVLTGKFPVQIRYALCDKSDAELWDRAYNYQNVPGGYTVRAANEIIGQ